MKILLAVDGSSCSEAALNEVTSRPWPAGSELRIVTAVAPPANLTPESWVGSEDYCKEVSRIDHETARSVVDKALSKLSAAEERPWKISSTVIDGSPKRVIVEEAERWGADLIVLGSHGYGSWNRLLLGSVSQVVSLHAPCSVEIVRAAAGKKSNMDEGLR
jgi:nucleotide-binding universal stress UspA family protein